VMGEKFMMPALVKSDLLTVGSILKVRREKRLNPFITELSRH